MDVSVIYFLVLLLNILLWIAISLHYRLYLWVLKIITIRHRKLKILKRIFKADDIIFGRYTHSWLGRGIVTLVLILENILMVFLPLKSTTYNLHTFSSRCGKLAVINLIWSLVLQFRVTKTYILSAPTFENDIWVSALLIWLSWHEAFIHTILSFGRISLRTGESTVPTLVGIAMTNFRLVNLSPLSLSFSILVGHPASIPSTLLISYAGHGNSSTSRHLSAYIPFLTRLSSSTPGSFLDYPLAGYQRLGLGHHHDHCCMPWRTGLENKVRTRDPRVRRII